MLALATLLAGTPRLLTGLLALAALLAALLALRAALLTGLLSRATVALLVGVHLALLLVLVVLVCHFVLSSDMPDIRPCGKGTGIAPGCSRKSRTPRGNRQRQADVCLSATEGVMAPRTFWKGYLKLSLVTCPVAMTPATGEGGRLRFHTLNRTTGNRVVQQYVDAGTGKPVAEEDEARGYPRGEDDHVLLEDDEIEAVALESTRTIDIERFVPQGSIGWIWYDKPHLLVPNDKVGEEAFAVIREAMAKTGMAGIARLVLYRRERAVMLLPRGKGIVLWTLRYGDEVRPEGEYFARLDDQKVDRDLLKLVGTLIDTRKADWTPDFVADPVQERLVDIIEAKRKGRSRPKKPAAPRDRPDNVVDIMDALKRSIAAEKRR